MQCVMIKYLVISLNVFQQLLTTFSHCTQVHPPSPPIPPPHSNTIRLGNKNVGGTKRLWENKYTRHESAHVKPFIFEQMGEKVTCVQGYLGGENLMPNLYTTGLIQLNYSFQLLMKNTLQRYTILLSDRSKISDYVEI